MPILFVDLPGGADLEVGSLLRLLLPLLLACHDCSLICLGVRIWWWTSFLDCCCRCFLLANTACGSAWGRGFGGGQSSQIAVATASCLPILCADLFEGADLEVGTLLRMQLPLHLACQYCLLICLGVRIWRLTVFLGCCCHCFLLANAVC